MVSALVRDSFFGQLVRLVTNDRLFKYPEEIDPSIWHQFINPEKSRNLALFGTPEGHTLETAEDWLERPNHDRIPSSEVVERDNGRQISSKALEAGVDPVNPIGLNPKTQPHYEGEGHGRPPPVTNGVEMSEKKKLVEGASEATVEPAGESTTRNRSSWRQSEGRLSSSDDSVTTRVDSNPQPYTKNEEVNSDKGRDILLVDWAPGDPEVHLSIYFML